MPTGQKFHGGKDCPARMQAEEGWTTTRVGGSLPQGSPVSPILFILSMTPIYRKIHLLLGYADDGALVVSGQSSQDNCRIIETLMEMVTGGTSQNGLDLDLGKSTLLHIKGRRRVAGNPSVTIEGLGEIKPTPEKKSMRWLGLHIDANLLFNGHIEKTTASINRVANSPRYLAGCYKGADTTCMLSAARACALSKTLFAANAWRGTETTKTAAEKINVAIKNRLRAALPVYRTIPRECLHHAPTPMARKTRMETGHIALGKWMEVADAEAHGAHEVAKRATTHADAEEIWLCLDNQGVVDRLRNQQTQDSTSRDVIDNTKRILSLWKR
ncbi:reverse transcriptase [Ceratocystis lukuohia]|uniref:Reverse transcriptase n=1 Tax=Ceratocystis lukuohia TaxID=2019550 RepID=A0ABR4MJW9_9PEZI